MTEKERMEQGSIYNPNVSELTDEQSIYIYGKIMGVQSVTPVRTG